MKTVEPFADRRDAGRILAGKLAKYAGKKPVVVGLPRGGVVVAAEVARSLGAALDVIVAGKLRGPDNPEFAIGAITEDGAIYLNDEAIRMLRITSQYLDKEKAEKLKTVRVKLARYRKVLQKTPLDGRAVIIVDDGLATGSTMISAVQAARASGAAEIIVAVPGGPLATIQRLKAMPEVDDVVCPVIPDIFFAVSQLYKDFRQTEDDEVAAILKEFAKVK